MPPHINQQVNQQAVVVGGSIAGLLAARVLAERFDRVTIVDRDRLPLTAEPRRGVPQSVQPHVLFTKGYRILEELFPGIGQALRANGAIAFDWGKDFRHFQRGDWSPTFAEAVGLDSFTCTRPLLESVIRQQVAKLPAVQFLAKQQVIGLCGDRSSGAISGVKLRQADGLTTELLAQLVVDASGRSTQVPQWLKEVGFNPPPATIVDPGLGYATRRYRIPAQHQPACKVLLISQQPPHQPRLGYLAEVENNEWIATLGGYGRHYPPIDDRGFLDFAQQLSSSDFYQAICEAEPRSEIRAHRATANRLHHYEQIDLPDGFVAIGDAVCALCPVYGQGITVSAISSLILRDWLAEGAQAGQPLPNGASFQKQLARSNAFPWGLATGFDSRFLTTEGSVSSNWVDKLLQGYMERLAVRAHQDADLHLKFIEMAHMMKPPSILFHPKVILKAVL